MSTKRAPTQKVNFTQDELGKLPLPANGRATYHDEKQAGLQLRITSNGTITFSVFARVAGGRPERITLGKYPAITPELARKKAKTIISDLAQGKSPNAAKRATRVQGVTLEEALIEYLADKRRKDGLPLKERTKLDYLKMVRAGRARKDGTRTIDGCLFKLADKPIHQITAAEIKALHTANLKRGQRSAEYAAQVLRAVLSWHVVHIPNSPFGKEARGKERIVIPPARASDDTPVENLLENLGPWWRALCGKPVSPATDYLKFLLLTGCRPAEPLKILIGDCDLDSGTATLRDTKNRLDLKLRLSRQALEIVRRNAQDKSPTDRLFAISDAKHAVQELVEATGIKFTPKTLRATFASLADDLVTASTLKRLLNHRQASDVSNVHYIKKLEVQLREGWQKIADHLDAQAADNIVALRLR
jgi:integrase